MKGKKVYIAGRITGISRIEAIKKFGEVEKDLEEKQATPFNPLCLPEGFAWEDYMEICLSAVNRCDTVVMLDNWTSSKGAQVEYGHAFKNNKDIYFYKDGNYTKQK
ncbi:DUF4406 domain-containing protein [Anaerovorax sp. IOR16]|uniref:DUF4406 domain-containing protein n=1 Tax=Anaerovorax sp. IOR16 TaxID=2773458 RepID=UPI0019D2D4EB|nr:DUF4406 domain-containing protein [Anaerovorax sp. IOR16]